MTSRRDFLKSFGLIGIAAPFAALPAIEKAVEQIAGLDVIKRVDFSQRATFRRYVDGRWFLEFASPDRLDVDFGNELVIAIENKEYILQAITDIQVSTEFLYGWSRERETDRDYIHWLTGEKWQEVGGIVAR